MRLLLTLLALLAPAASAAAVPRAFYGTTYDGEVRAAPAETQTGAWKEMRSSGVGAARTVFAWAQAKPAEDAHFNFGLTDVYVGDAARSGVQLLPIVMSTPLWAKADAQHWWPRDPDHLGDYTRALVRRYGPGGRFWEENAEIPKRPIRHWQIYNEPGRTKRYGPVLRAAYRAIKKADRGASVVLAGITGTEGNGTPWDVLDYLYRKGGIKGFFDLAAIHMYTGKPANVLEGIKLFRRVMRENGDARTPIWLTEFGITASKGRTEAPASQRTLRTTDTGMAAFLRKAYRSLRQGRKAVGLQRAYWYTWASSYKSGSGIFRFAGLNEFSDGRLEPKPALEAYRQGARG